MARTGKYFASEHFGLVPDLVLSPRASRAACRWPPSPDAPRSWTRPSPAGSAARSAATRSRAPRRSPCSSEIESKGLLAEADAHRERAEAGAARAPGEVPDHRRGARYRRDARDRARQARHARAECRRGQRDRRVRGPAGRARAHRRNLRQRAALPAEPRDQRRAAARGGLACSTTRSRRCERCARAARARRIRRRRARRARALWADRITSPGAAAVTDRTGAGRAHPRRCQCAHFPAVRAQAAPGARRAARGRHPA